MILQADARHIPLADNSVQCCVTSPPYWGLRDYGTATWEGGSEECDHKPPASSKGDYPKSNRKQQTNAGSFGYREWLECGKCGAVRIDRQLGLERTPEEYVANMVAVFREVRRVLREDGTCWVNMGDSYVAGRGVDRDGNPRSPGVIAHVNTGDWIHASTKNQGFTTQGRGVGKGSALKPKDLVGIPWRLAFALQADGWYLRSDIIWAKPNPMPESVTDRPTKSHEYIFLLTKSARYYFDQEAVREPYIESNGGWQTRQAGNKVVHATSSMYAQAPGMGGVGRGDHAGRNLRSVWTIATAPYPEAHFATFPPEIPKRCILAGTKAGDVVLDPFAGSGTTVAVAESLGRRGVGLELKAEYIALAKKRCQVTLGLPL